MDNEITITLTGAAALDYIKAEKHDNYTVEVLQNKLNALQYKYDELASQQNPYRLLKESDIRIDRDTELAKDVQTIPPEIKTAIEAPTVKLKTRLSKADKIDLEVLSKRNFTSDHRVDKFAKARNVRPSTVITYIIKHSKGAFTLVKGSSIKQGDYGFKLAVAKEALYFTSNDGRYDSVHIQ